MSWNGGSQLTMCWSGSSWKNWLYIAAMLWSRLPWLTITPLGRLVEPEVYWRKAMSSRADPGWRQPSAAALSRSSTASQAMSRSAGARSAKRSAKATVSAGARTATGWASSRTPVSRGRVRIRKAGSGGYTGTAMRPAYRQAKKEAT